MKFTFASLILSLAGSVLGQNVIIRSPAEGTTLAPGSTFVVQVDKPNSLSPSVDVSVAIGMESCVDAGCDQISQAQILGHVLFKGDYEPQLQPGTGALSQNYTIQVPATMASGPAVITAAHFYLGGAGASPVLDTANTTVNVE